MIERGGLDLGGCEGVLVWCVQCLYGRKGRFMTVWRWGNDGMLM